MSYLNDPKNQVLNLQTDSGLAIRRNRRRNQTSYVNPVFEMEQADLANKVQLINKITSADKAKAILNNKFFWIFIVFIILVGIFFAIVYLVPQVHTLVCGCIEGADACAKCCGDCANDADCCAKSGDCGK